MRAAIGFDSVKAYGGQALDLGSIPKRSTNRLEIK